MNDILINLMKESVIARNSIFEIVSKLTDISIEEITKLFEDKYLK